MRTELFTCPLCGNEGIATAVPSGSGVVWTGSCNSYNCAGVEETEILGEEGKNFPVEEWGENYDAW